MLLPGKALSKDDYKKEDNCAADHNITLNEHISQTQVLPKGPGLS